MAYLLYSLSFFGLIFVAVLYRLYLHRTQHTPLLPTTLIPSIPYLYTPVPNDNSSFTDDAASGMHSSTFDLSQNIEGGDSRKGLDAKGKAEVQRMMNSKGVGFDEARRLVVQEAFRREGIGADGRPRDPKFVSFS